MYRAYIKFVVLYYGTNYGLHRILYSKVLWVLSVLQVIVGSFVCGSSKTKEKDGQSLGSAGDLDQQTVDNSVTITSFPPSQNLTSTSSMGTWPGSVQMAHGDIDLMHG